MCAQTTIVIPFELKATFLRETNEGLRKAKLAFERLRNDPSDNDSLDEVGMFFHRLAGTAHSMEYPTLGRLSMVCETVADLMKDEELSRRARALEMFSDGLAGVAEVLAEHGLQAPSKKARLTIDEPESNKSDSRIMVIDDDPFSAGLIDNCLRSAGFVSSFETDPSRALTKLETETPDLIILDVEMPGMDGFELCKLIRLRPAHNFTPVLFVTRKGNVDQRVRGLEVGGNDYISKPFEPQELVARVRSHLQRLSVLQDMAIRDGLTRCFNHKYFKIRVEQEIESARRYNAPFSLAMMDIDHFKKVNDTWGHPAGDAVLIHLANLIAASIRSSDTLARYGGEEFGVLLTEAGAKEAGIICSRIRERVAREPSVLPEVDGREPQQVSTTVSIGVAEFRVQDSLQTLVQRADNALYTAKTSGRNQVRIAE